MKRRVGGHERIAVPVCPDPGAEPQERPDRGRAGPRPAGVGRHGDPGTERGAALRQPVQRRVDGPVHPRHDGEQRLVEEGQAGPDLVERGGRDGPDLGRPPERRDLPAEMPADLGVLVRGHIRVGEPFEQAADPPERDEQGAPPRLGRVRREDRRHDEPAEQGIDARWGIGRHLRGPEASERLGDRPVGGPTRRPMSGAPERPHPVPLLGQVDELEVEGERAGEGLELVAVEGRDVGGDALLDAMAGVLVGREGTAADRDEPRAQALDEREQLRTRLLGDDLAEQRAEKADLARERVASPADAGAGGFRGDGGEAVRPAPAARARKAVAHRRTVTRRGPRRRRSRRSAPV